MRKKQSFPAGHYVTLHYVTFHSNRSIVGLSKKFSEDFIFKFHCFRQF